MNGSVWAAQFRVNGNRCAPAIDFIKVKEGLAERTFAIAEEQIFDRLHKLWQKMLDDLVRVGKIRVAKIAGTSAIAPTKVFFGEITDSFFGNNDACRSAFNVDVDRHRDLLCCRLKYVRTGN
ncbi:MAG: hypothetical protein KC877_02735 [Candidatus Kaiserbacteria bacterium]|nr:hypothetical protein [Candidatus Kaiserbacteria bacterium]